MHAEWLLTQEPLWVEWSNQMRLTCWVYFEASMSSYMFQSYSALPSCQIHTAPHQDLGAITAYTAWHNRGSCFVVSVKFLQSRTILSQCSISTGVLKNCRLHSWGVPNKRLTPESLTSMSVILIRVLCDATCKAQTRQLSSMQHSGCITQKKSSRRSALEPRPVLWTQDSTLRRAEPEYLG